MLPRFWVKEIQTATPLKLISSCFLQAYHTSVIAVKKSPCYTHLSMPKKLIIIVIIILGLTVLGILLRSSLIKKIPLSAPSPAQQAKKAVTPSATFKEYSDPSGFTFNYPDNLSLINREITDNSAYADIQLSSKDTNGSLSLRISDSKYTSLDEWLKQNKDAAIGTPKEVRLGSLKALEIRTNDRLLLGALDKGVLFSIEMPLVEENFWKIVYTKILADFSFTSPDNTSSDTTTNSSSDVTLEGEEVIE